MTHRSRLGVVVIGGATENRFACMLALVLRPQRLFGDKIIERV